MTEKTDLKKIINWSGLSEVLKGNTSTIRANRINKKFTKQIESLEKHLNDWAKENNIQNIE